MRFIHFITIFNLFYFRSNFLALLRSHPSQYEPPISMCPGTIQWEHCPSTIQWKHGPGACRKWDIASKHAPVDWHGCGIPSGKWAGNWSIGTIINPLPGWAHSDPPGGIPSGPTGSPSSPSYDSLPVPHGPTPKPGEPQWAWASIGIFAGGPDGYIA